MKKLAIVITIATGIFLTLFIKPVVFFIATFVSPDWLFDERRIDKRFVVTNQWQTIAFDYPLRVDPESIQVLHLGLDSRKYDDDVGYMMSKNAKSDVRTPLPRFIDIRRLSDEKLIVPDIELIAADGRQVMIRATASRYWPNGDFSVAYGTFGPTIYDASPPYPKDIEKFTSMRIRSDEPFVVLFMGWREY